MEGKNSQENAIEPIEPTETKINIPTTEVDIDILSRTQQHRENVDEIIVPQYIHYIEDQYIENNYVVTYSKKDNSILSWKINIEENGQQHPDVDAYIKLDKSYTIWSFKLCKKTL